MVLLACPRRCWTNFGCTPRPRRRVAHVCLRSCQRIGGSSARCMRVCGGRQSQCLCASFRSSVPRAFAGVSPRSIPSALRYSPSETSPRAKRSRRISSAESLGAPVPPSLLRPGKRRLTTRATSTSSPIQNRNGMRIQGPRKPSSRPAHGGPPPQSCPDWTRRRPVCRTSVTACTAVRPWAGGVIQPSLRACPAFGVETLLGLADVVVVAARPVLAQGRHGPLVLLRAHLAAGETLAQDLLSRVPPASRPAATFAQPRQETERSPGQEARSEDTRLNSSHANISYAVFCLKKKKT